MFNSFAVNFNYHRGCLVCLAGVKSTSTINNVGLKNRGSSQATIWIYSVDFFLGKLFVYYNQECIFI